ncbi:MAG: hypothetical protein PF636_05025 [Actinomycetota bacterium]|nr:hypothetical protein [Actinomycetota bacterium]
MDEAVEKEPFEVKALAYGPRQDHESEFAGYDTEEEAAEAFILGVVSNDLALMNTALLVEIPRQRALGWRRGLFPGPIPFWIDNVTLPLEQLTIKEADMWERATNERRVMLCRFQTGIFLTGADEDGWRTVVVGVVKDDGLWWVQDAFLPDADIYPDLQW